MNVCDCNFKILDDIGNKFLGKCVCLCILINICKMKDNFALKNHNINLHKRILNNSKEQSKKLSFTCPTSSQKS